MTLGERISSKRKECGISQEALGEKLSVSRQTIYKWESDQAIPELNNLIAMAKILNVKVGWLIAEEENELSNQTYDDVTKIVENVMKRSKLNDSSNKKEPKSLTRYILGLLVLIYFVVFFTFKFIDLDRKYNQLDRNLANYQYYTQQQIGQISQNVQTALDNYNNIVLNSNVEIERFDFENNVAYINVNAKPKKYTTGMNAIFHVECNGTKSDFEGKEKDKEFEAIVEVPILSNKVVISAEFLIDDVSEFITLSEFNDLSSYTFPFYTITWSFEISLNDKRTGFDDEYFEVINYGYEFDAAEYSKKFEMPKIVSVEAYLCEDGKKIANYMYDESYNRNANHTPEIRDGDDMPIFMWFKRPDGLNLDPNKTYTEHVLVTDEYGRMMDVISGSERSETLYYLNSK